MANNEYDDTTPPLTLAEQSAEETVSVTDDLDNTTSPMPTPDVTLTEPESASTSTENFDDDLSFDDEDAFLQEHDDSFEHSSFDDGFDDFDYENDSRPTTSSSSTNWFNIGIIGAAILGIAGISYAFLPGILGGNNTNQAQQNIQPAQMAEQNITQDVQNMPSAPQPQGLLQNPDLVMTEQDMQDIQDQIAQQDTTGVFDILDQPPSSEEAKNLFDLVRNGQEPVVDSQDDILDGSFETSSPSVDFDTLPFPADTATSSMPSAPEDMSGMNNDTIPPQADPENMAVSSSSTAMDAVNTRLDSMAMAMENMMQRMDEMANNAMAAQQSATMAVAPTVDNGAEINALRQTITTLENRISTLNADITDLKKQPRQTATTTSSSSPRSDIATPKVSTTPKRQTRRAAPPLPPRMTYDLRGASSGRAVIAKQGTNNLQTIQVGDTVQGLGKITSIIQENNRWVVRGTGGTVTR